MPKKNRHSETARDAGKRFHLLRGLEQQYRDNNIPVPRNVQADKKRTAGEM